MKVLLLAALFGPAQSAGPVVVYLKNTTGPAREFRFLTRNPAEKYPNVFTAFLQPGESYRATFRVGTTLALVTQADINATMRGALVPGRQLLVVRPGDAGRTLALPAEPR